MAIYSTVGVCECRYIRAKFRKVTKNRFSVHDVGLQEPTGVPVLLRMTREFAEKFKAIHLVLPSLRHLWAGENQRTSTLVHRTYVAFYKSLW